MVFKGYFSEETIQHLALHNGQSRRHYQRSQDIKLACKLTLTYGKYHLMMLHRQLAMSEERTSFQQAERTADMIQDDRLPFVTNGLPAYTGTEHG